MTDQPERLWERFYDLLHNEGHDAAEQVAIYAENVGLDVTAAQMRETMKTTTITREPQDI